MRRRPTSQSSGSCVNSGQELKPSEKSYSERSALGGQKMPSQAKPTSTYSRHSRSSSQPLRLHITKRFKTCKTLSAHRGEALLTSYARQFVKYSIILRQTRR